MNARTVYTTHGQHVNLPWIREVIPEPWIEISAYDAHERDIRTGIWCASSTNAGRTR